MKLRFFLLAAFCANAALAQTRLTNLSVRSTAGSGSETLIVGFSIGGTGTKPVLVRGIGPTLTGFGVTGVVADPLLRLYGGSTQIDENDNWGGGTTLASSFTAVGAFALPASSPDAALLRPLAPGSYSAHLVASSGTGVALVECYDSELGQGAAFFTNVSARSVAGTGANVLTVGFAIVGADAKPVLIRGVGPTLNLFGVTGLLADPRLRLFNAAGVEIANNDNWVSAVTPLSLFDSVGAFHLPLISRDAVLFFALPAGTYTAQISGAANTTGAALIEVYEVNNSTVPFISMKPVVNAPAGAPADPGVGTPSPGADVFPAVRTQVVPVYPLELRRASITGEVLVDFYVKTDGTVANVVAIRATDIQFATAAVAAVQSWTFVSGRRNGALVTTHLQVPIIFTLNN